MAETRSIEMTEVKDGGKVVDVAIVGAGPLGLALAAALRARGRTLVHFDRGSIGNTIAWFSPGLRFYSSARNLEILGFPLPSSGEKPTREEYLAYLRSFARFHQLEVNTFEEVASIERSATNFRLFTKRRSGASRQFLARAIVLAIGSTELPHRLDVPGEDLPHVRKKMPEAHELVGSRVVIIGAGNSACDAAVTLARLGAAVTLVHRRPTIDTTHIKYWIHPELMSMIRHGEIQTRLDCSVARIEPEWVVVRRNSDGQCERLPADAVLALIGYSPDLTLLKQLGVTLSDDRHRPVIEEATLATNVPGVYCCGTIVAGDQRPYRVFIENARHQIEPLADAMQRFLSGE